MEKKNPQQNTSQRTQQHSKRIIYHDQVGFIPKYKSSSAYENQCTTPHYQNEGGKHYMIISFNAEKAFENI